MKVPDAKPRILALDMDGTLLGPDGRVSARNLAALRAAEEQGIEIVIATGRRHCYAMRILRDLGLRKSHALVSSNGAVIRTIGAELLQRTLLPLDVAARLCERLAAYRDTLVLTFDLVGPDGEDAEGALVVEDVDALHGSVSQWMRANASAIRNVAALEEALRGDAPIQMMVCGPVERMRAAEVRLLARDGIAGTLPTEHERLHGPEFALHRTEYPEKDLCIVDILPPGCSKGAALAWLAELRGCTLDDVLAIGDNWNDVSMLEVAGTAVLMANAPEDLRERGAASGWTLGRSNRDDGVAVAVEAALGQQALAFR